MNLIVMKFGGISIQDTESINIVIDIIKKNEKQSIVLVFSAMGKTTRRLLKCAQQAAAGNKGIIISELNLLFENHFNLIKNFKEYDPGYSEDLLKNYQEELETLMHGLFDLGEFSAKIRDRLLAYGELMSTVVLTHALLSRNCNAVLTDAREMVITDDCFTRANLLIEETRERFKSVLLPILRSGKIPVVQGFIGSTLDGITTTLGFEGSDFTAAIAAGALNADRIEVWKKVPGIMTADPAICSQAHIISTLSYNQAATLCRMGAKVLHPATLEPAEQASIPVFVKDTANPASAGTMIREAPDEESGSLLSIAYRENITLLRIKVSTQVSPDQAIHDISSWFEQSCITPFLISYDNGYILAAAESGDSVLPHCRSIDHVGTIQSFEQTSTISIIGNELHHASLLGEIFSVIQDKYIEFFFHGNSPYHFTFSIRPSDLHKVLNLLHDHFFSDTKEI